MQSERELTGVEDMFINYLMKLSLALMMWLVQIMDVTSATYSHFTGNSVFHGNEKKILVH